MKNVGGKSGQWLKNIGVESVADVEERGIANIYVELKLGDYNVTNNMMWALWGAVNDTHWQNIPPAEKDKLIAEVNTILQDS